VSGNHLLLVLAADDQDYIDWCEETGRRPCEGSAWAISGWTGFLWYGHSRCFQVTDRWIERGRNRGTLADLKRHGVLYGDENGPWAPWRAPDLSWPSWWRRAFQNVHAS
jgi:hypothetical protein